MSRKGTTYGLSQLSAEDVEILKKGCSIKYLNPAGFFVQKRRAKVDLERNVLILSKHREVPLDELRSVIAGQKTPGFEYVKGCNCIFCRMKGVKRKESVSYALRTRKEDFEIIGSNSREFQSWLRIVMNLTDASSRAVSVKLGPREPSAKAVELDDVVVEPLHVLFTRHVWDSLPKAAEGKLLVTGLCDAIERLDLGVAERYTLRLKTSLERERPDGIDFPEFCAAILSLTARPELQLLFDEYSGEDSHLTAESLQRFLQEKQKEDVSLAECEAIISNFDGVPIADDDPERPKKAMHMLGFLRFMRHERSSIVDPEAVSAPHRMDLPLNSYFIYSARPFHYSEARVDDPTLDLLEQLLRGGCRCVELSFWTGPNGQPVVYPGKSDDVIPARDVLECIRKNAFISSQFPLILTLDMHLTSEQEAVLAATIGDVLQDLLVPRGSKSDPLPSPFQLRNRILIQARAATSDEHDDDIGYDTASSDEEDDFEDMDGFYTRPVDAPVMPAAELMDTWSPFNASTPGTRSPDPERMIARSVRSDIAMATAEVAPVRQPNLLSSIMNTFNSSFKKKSAEELTSTQQFRSSTLTLPGMEMRTGDMSQGFLATLTQTITARFGQSGLAAHIALTPSPFKNIRDPFSKPAEYVEGKGLWHVLTLTEKESKDAMRKDPDAFVEYSRKYLLQVAVNPSLVVADHAHHAHAKPSGRSGADAMRLWGGGCQMVDLSFLPGDRNTALNNAIFMNNASSGYVLKPSYLRLLTPEESSHQRAARLNVQIISGQQIPSTTSEEPNLLVQCDVFGGGGPKSLTRQRFRTPVVEENGFNPSWNASFDSEVENVDLSICRFTVFQSLQNQETELGSSVVALSWCRQGYHQLPLSSPTEDRIPNASLFCSITFSLI